VRALLDFAFECCVRFLKLGSHAVELIAQGFEFVAGGDRNALVEVAAADPHRTGTQCLYRDDHLSGKNCAAENGENECTQQHQTDTLNR
jgi:hypothetical protein